MVDSSLEASHNKFILCLLRWRSFEGMALIDYPLKFGRTWLLTYDEIFKPNVGKWQGNNSHNFFSTLALCLAQSLGLCFKRWMFFFGWCCISGGSEQNV